MSKASSLNATDAFSEIIERAVEAGIRKALNLSEATNRRLMTVPEAATYLAISKSGVYNLIAAHEFPSVKCGSRTMIDIQDLDNWIDRNKC